MVPLAAARAVKSQRDLHYQKRYFLDFDVASLRGRTILTGSTIN